ncbi:MAG: hypothetical protein ACAH20_02620 [Methylobacteriaceae bacterium]|mgnify:CR=1 FL=1|jgi:hypothetical protein|uniref:Uncharacterized protein n=3 Tax=Methylorubrum extorquens TaxID=408 RepID=B7KS69_METC4|nr:MULTISPECIES: hypothetical protein [Methylorubrum]KQO93145.1 hypothetical protein ASF36_02360 [Methylobacterium sp. Leaf90]KQP86595.1 hypothetical protein ASF55_09245 [Methylobacterium sp. Leaf119]MBA9067620.1 hypothetical protein [Methylobacterium sp. RAS18]MDF9864883.1 hypothetical protein [Methylorubrum pseudosasae]MDH6638458.1 hypothetical protein [Methylobacterium sp. SuP10 SLI 274]MDH6667641.1 hypothetical protein [Methylorubrum zatmanii]
MSHPDSPSALLDHRAIVPGHRAMQAAYLWIIATLTAAAGVTGLVYLEADRNGREAGRMIVAAQNGSSYAAILVHGMAQRHGRPTP